jgi:outer membrane protein
MKDKIAQCQWHIYTKNQNLSLVTSKFYPLKITFYFCRFIFFSLFLFFSRFSLEGIEQEGCLVLNLTKAISTALTNNRQLLGSIDSLTKSHYGVTLANSVFDIQFTPNTRAGYVGGGRAGTGMSIGGGLDASKKFPIGTLLTLGPSVLKTKEHYHTEVRAMISQPLLRGLGKFYQLSPILSAQFSLRSAYRNLYSAQVQLIVRTIQSLYEIVKAEKSVELNEESFQRVKKFYYAANLKEKIGLADSLDVYRAELEMRHAEDALTSSKERLQDAEDTVRELLALPLNQCIKVEVPLVYTPSSILVEKAIELTLEHRIEMDQSRDQWKENKRLAKVAEKNLYPELNLVFNYSNCGRDEFFTRSCTRRRESTWGVGFTTSTDFDPVAERLNYEQALLTAEAALRGIDQTEASLILDVKKAVRQLNRSYQRILLQEEQIKTATSELYLTQIKFDRGIVTDNFNIIQSEKSLRAAQQIYWAALIEHIVGEYQLLAAMGLLIDKPTIRS